MSEAAEGVSAPAEAKYLNVRQAAFIGVGSMVGAGIFALLGAAGAVAGVALGDHPWAQHRLDYWWKRAGTGRAKRVQAAPSPLEQG